MSHTHQLGHEYIMRDYCESFIDQLSADFTNACVIHGTIADGLGRGHGWIMMRWRKIAGHDDWSLIQASQERHPLRVVRGPEPWSWAQGVLKATTDLNMETFGTLLGSKMESLPGFGFHLHFYTDRPLRITCDAKLQVVEL
jgi:hypothetical protein